MWAITLQHRHMHTQAHTYIHLQEKLQPLSMKARLKWYKNAYTYFQRHNGYISESHGWLEESVEWRRPVVQWRDSGKELKGSKVCQDRLQKCYSHKNKKKASSQSLPRLCSRQSLLNFTVISGLRKTPSNLKATECADGQAKGGNRSNFGSKWQPHGVLRECLILQPEIGKRHMSYSLRINRKCRARVW